MKKYGYIIIVSILMLSLTTIVYGQKKKPTRTTTVPQDTSITTQEKPEITKPADPGLPTIELKEHTIVGERIITDIPEIEKTTDTKNIPAITANPTGEGKGNRWISGAGGIKMDQSIFYPTSNVSNQFYSSYGRYNDTNVGLKLRKKYIDDELFLDMDYRYNSGHVDSSDYLKFRNTLTNVHRFNRYIQNKTQFNLTNYTYKYYGATIDPDEERSRINFDVSTTTGITGWEKANIRWDAGARYMDPDASQLFDWGLWTNLSIGKTIGTSFLTTTFSVQSDRIEVPLNAAQLDSLYEWLDENRDAAPIKYLERVREDISNNSLLSDAFHGNVRSTIEHVFGRNLKVKGGVNVTYHINNNEHGLAIGDGEKLPPQDEKDLKVNRDANITYHFKNSEYNLAIGEIEALPPQDELTTVYPILGMEFNLGPMGSLFSTFEPSLENVSLINTLDMNPYINMSAPLSYQDIISNLKIGWRRSGTYDLSFETYYNFRDINNYGIIVPQTSGSVEDNFGRWDIVYNNDIQFHEIRAMINWSITDKVAFWSSIGYNHYEIIESDFADQIPYLPKFYFNFVFRALPGKGFELMLNGQLISDQYTLPYNSDTGEDDLIESHFITNLSLSKKIGTHFEIYAQVNNILNSEYENWKGYIAPEINGWGGIKIFW